MGLLDFTIDNDGFYFVFEGNYAIFEAIFDDGC